MPVDKGKTNCVCPDCGGEKYRYSAKCRSCWAKSRTKDENSKWMRGKRNNENYGKSLCPNCKKNYKHGHASQCMECELESRVSGRNGDQICVRCGTKLSDDNWSKSRKKYWTRICVKCDNLDKANRRDKIKASIKESNKKIKFEMIAAYGGKCVCCSEDRAPFLTIDHIDGRGGEHLKHTITKTGKKSYRLSGTMLYRWLKDHGWPTDNYQLMCMNCNFAKSHNPGGCPHEIERQKALAQNP